MKNLNFIEKSFVFFIIFLIAFVAYTSYRIMNTINEKQPYAIKKDTTIVYLSDTTTHHHSTNNVYSTNVYSTLPYMVDTQKIIAMYFTKYFLTDTLQDSLVKIIVNDTLHNNKISFRKYHYNLLKPYQKIVTINEVQTFTKSVNGFYIGSSFGFSSQQKKIVGAGIACNYVTKRLNYGVGYDLLNNSINAQLLFKIQP